MQRYFGVCFFKCLFVFLSSLSSLPSCFLSLTSCLVKKIKNAHFYVFFNLRDLVSLDWLNFHFGLTS